MFGRKIEQLHYIDKDAFLLSRKTGNFIEDLYNLRDLFDFSNLNLEHETFHNKNKKAAGKFKIERRRSNWVDELICLTANAFSFKFNNRTQTN